MKIQYNTKKKKKKKTIAVYLVISNYLHICFMLCITRDTLFRTESKERKEIKNVPNKKKTACRSALPIIYLIYIIRICIIYIYIYHFAGRLFRGWSVLHLINPLIFSPLASSTITFFAITYISKTSNSQCARLQYFVGHDFYQENVSW